jgi:hypothetical protein
MHSRPQLSTTFQSESSCQHQEAALSSRQIESGSVKNFSAQSKEGAIASQLTRPQIFLRLIS